MILGKFYSGVFLYRIQNTESYYSGTSLVQDLWDRKI